MKSHRVAGQCAAIVISTSSMARSHTELRDPGGAGAGAFGGAGWDLVSSLRMRLPENYCTWKRCWCFGERRPLACRVWRPAKCFVNRSSSHRLAGTKAGNEVFGGPPKTARGPRALPGADLDLVSGARIEPSQVTSRAGTIARPFVEGMGKPLRRGWCRRMAGRDGALRRPAPRTAAQFEGRNWFIPPAVARARTSRRDGAGLQIKAISQRLLAWVTRGFMLLWSS